MSSAVRAFFDAIARRYDRAYALDRDATRVRMDAIISLLPPRARVLDLGVGTGRELPFLLDRGHDVVGLDVSPEMLAICARRARPIDLVEGDLWAPLPFPDAAFDAVIALHGTLAHPPPDVALHDAVTRLANELARVVRPGGVFVAEVPAPEWTRGEASFAHVDDATGARIEGQVLAPATWRELFAAAGFEVDVEPITTVEQRVVARSRS